ncbi:MAG: phosphomannomutase/phosphoglucomutase [Gammaproteobacteria bacterium]|nr:MAG: phosphomannomutase/phosphoglucomutase [Gammaproteobacteria bacterium]
MVLRMGLALGILGAIVFGRELVFGGWERIDDYYVGQAARAASRAVEDRLAVFAGRLDAESSNPAVRRVLASGDVDMIAVEQARIAGLFPTALRVMLLDADVERLRPGPFPQPGFATLDVLKNAKRAGAAPEMEAHLFGHEGQHIDLVRRVDVEDGSVVLGFLLVSLPVETVIDVFQQAATEGGYFELRQGTSRPHGLLMASRGEIRGSLFDPQGIFDIPGSRFHVAYMAPVRVGLLGTRNTLALSTGFVSSLLLVMLLMIQWRRATRMAAARSIPAPVWMPPETLEEEPAVSGTIAADVEEAPTVDVPASIFRAYDIRGIVGDGLTPETVEVIGRAIGSEARERGLSDIIVGRDGRESGPELCAALVEGLTSTGCNIIDIGMVTSPMLYYATHHLSTSSGVMVTGSHNPSEYNGFKIMLDGETLSDAAIRSLHTRILESRFAKGNGRYRERDIGKDYVDRVVGNINLDRPLKVVVDCGNGVGGLVAPQIFEAIGCQVIPLYCEVDGTFPNHHPDPSVLDNLRDLMMTVGRAGADLGLAFDGDADRLGLVTPSGKVIYPDRIMMLLARDVLTRNPGQPIIFDVKCSRYLADVILENGGEPVMWRTGHSLIKRKMKELKAPLAGEMSGHIFFAERWYGFDDAVYAGARVLEILAADSRTTDEVFDELPEGVSTPELKIHMAEGSQYEFMDKFRHLASFEDASVTTIDGIRADWRDGWGLVRCSNTTPCLVLRFDADNPKVLARIQETFREQLLSLDPDLKLPF